jgi:hypothetical protein
MPDAQPPYYPEMGEEPIPGQQPIFAGALYGQQAAQMQEADLPPLNPQPQQPPPLETIRIPTPPSAEEFAKLPRYEQEYWVTMKRQLQAANDIGATPEDIYKTIYSLNLKRFDAANNASIPRIQRQTNDGIVTTWALHPSRAPERLPDPQIEKTPQGSMIRVNPTNAVPVTIQGTTNVMQNYLGEPVEDGGAGGIFGQTNTPTNPPSPTPTPAPAQKPVSVAELQSRLGIALPPGTHTLPNGRTITVIP